MNKKILEILENDANTPLEQIAVMADISVEEAAAEIERMYKEKILLGTKAVINWEKAQTELVSAIIELNVTPQRGEGFDKIAERIHKFPQVKTLYLMAGSSDLTLIIEGKTMTEVAMFVANRLSPMECVVNTSTHFVLKTYKYEGYSFEDNEADTREVISL